MNKNVKHIVFGMSGNAKSGKDEFIEGISQKHSVTQISIIDQAKRQVAYIWGFSHEQLFGSLKDTGDTRYPKKTFSEYGLEPLTPDKAEYQHFDQGKDKYYFCKARNFLFKRTDEADYPYRNLRLGECIFYIKEQDPNFWLSPREVLQVYCTSQQELYEDIWIENGMSIHEFMRIHSVCTGYCGNTLISCDRRYDEMRGLISGKTEWRNNIMTACNSIRHMNEIDYMRKNASRLGILPVIIRVKRPNQKILLSQHRTEIEQATIPDDVFDFVIINDGSIKDLHEKAAKIADAVSDPSYKTVGGLS